jgi:pyruvate/2-oxoglutarate dehydrogenase complex dihydrolipoamide acyltransferase (E2) component
MQEFRLPDLGEGMQEAEIRRWLVKPGDTVKLDQPMVEVETDKAVVEIPSPLAGQIKELCVPEGARAKLGDALVLFDTPAPAHQSAARSSSTTTVSVSASAVTSSTATVSANADTTIRRRVLAAPAVRKRAFELNIDLEQVPSTQPNGRVTMEDLQVYLERKERRQREGTTPTTTSAQPELASTNGATTPTTTPALVSGATEERQPLTGLRRRIAEHMEHSWRTIPHAVAFDELDGTALVALRQQLMPLAEQRGVRLTYMPLLVKLLIPVLKEFPIFNASLDEEKREIVYKRFYHIGIATDSPEGLLVPVLRDADHLTIIQIAQQLEHLVSGAQQRSLSLQEVSGSTFTLNNIGSFGGSSGAPIINYPEAAILAVGRLQEKAVVQNGTICARIVMPLALSFDHRLIDGALAGKFLARFKEITERPQQLMLDMI